mmetsp:Transcript_65689/g.105865  ORF Transcript_65689/g.105865 Transcript_65689/m.105865 type:complete len:342 (-) Transcript_65689:1228-2253(-)
MVVDDAWPRSTLHFGCGHFADLLRPLAPHRRHVLPAKLRFCLQGLLLDQPAQDAGPVALGEEPAGRSLVGVESCSEVGNGSQQQGSPDTNGHCGIQWEQKSCHDDCGLLGSIREVVVPGTQNMMCPDMKHLSEAAVEVGRCTIELLAILLRILVVTVGVARHILILIQVGKLVHQCSATRKCVAVRLGEGVKQQGVLRNWQRYSLSSGRHLHQVRAVRSSSAVARVIVVIGIGTRPLEVEVGALLNHQILRNKVVLNRGVDLHDVASAASDVVVHNASSLGHLCRTLLDHESVRAVLERATKLVRVDLQLQQAARVRARAAELQPIGDGVLTKGDSTCGAP